MAADTKGRPIESEQDAYELLREVLEGAYDGAVTLSGWPSLNVHLTRVCRILCNRDLNYR